MVQWPLVHFLVACPCLYIFFLGSVVTCVSKTHTHRFGAVEMCDPTYLSSFSEGDNCRCDVLASHWVAGKTAGGEKECATFKYNPGAKLTVSADGPVAVALLQPDVRCMFLPGEEDVTTQQASVYLTHVTKGTSPHRLLT